MIVSAFVFIDLLADNPYGIKGIRGHAALRARWTESAVLPRYFDLIRRVAEQRGMNRVLDALGASGQALSQPVGGAEEGRWMH